MKSMMDCYKRFTKIVESYLDEPIEERIEKEDFFYYVQACARILPEQCDYHRLYLLIEKPTFTGSDRTVACFFAWFNPHDILNVSNTAMFCRWEEELRACQGRYYVSPMDQIKEGIKEANKGVDPTNDVVALLCHGSAIACFTHHHATNKRGFFYLPFIFPYPSMDIDKARLMRKART